MTNLLDRRPDRPLPPGLHDKLRADLLAAIETEPSRSPRRYLVPAVAAAAVLALILGLHAFRPYAQPAVTGPTHPTVRTLPAAETEKLHQQCLAESDRITSKQLPRPFHDFKVVKAFEFTGINDPSIVTTWLVGDGVEDPNQRRPKSLPPLPEKPRQVHWFCSRTKDGRISESSIRSGGKSQLIGSPLHLMARNAGGFTTPVTRVTVQPPGQAELEAYLMGSYWFAPTDGRLNWGPYDADDPQRGRYIVRGYDATGKQVTIVPDPTLPPTVHCDMVTKTLPDGTLTSVPKTPTPPECRQYPWTGNLG